MRSPGWYWINVEDLFIFNEKWAKWLIDCERKTLTKNMPAIPLFYPLYHSYGGDGLETR
jgi:hypothetical protein